MDKLPKRLLAHQTPVVRSDVRVCSFANYNLQNNNFAVLWLKYSNSGVYRKLSIRCRLAICKSVSHAPSKPLPRGWFFHEKRTCNRSTSKGITTLVDGES